MKAFLGIVLAASILFNIKQYVDAVEYKETAEESVAAVGVMEKEVVVYERLIKEQSERTSECEDRAAEWLSQRNELLKQLPSVGDIEITGDVNGLDGKPLSPDLERKCKAAVRRAQAQLDIARGLSCCVEMLQGDPNGKTSEERLNRWVLVIQVPKKEN